MKRILKLLISLGVRASDVMTTAWARLTGRPVPGSCIVIYYHGIRPEFRAGFARQMDDVARLTTALPGDHAGPLEPGRRYSMVTFDDGFISYIEQALPELEARGLPSTNFVPTGSLGKPPQWIKRAGHPGLLETVMTPEQLAELGQRPLATIGSHSINHPDFLTLDPATAAREFAESKHALESVLRRPVTTFSFPHGRFNRSLATQALEAGYSRLFGIQPHPARETTAHNLLGRVAVEPDDWPLEFRLKLLGAYRWMARGEEG